MKRSFFLLAAAALLLAACSTPQPAGNGTVSSSFTGSVRYDDWFTTERLRLDFVLAGDAAGSSAYLQEMHRECLWTGSPEQLIDPFGYGAYYVEAFSQGGELLFSKGFNSLFDEWTTTDQAKQTRMAMSQSFWMPFPKQPVDICLYRRVRETGIFEPLLKFTADPADRHIITQPEHEFAVLPLQEAGDPAHKVDLLFLGEGYSSSELPKLRADAARMMEYMFSMEPYSTRRNDFNVSVLESVSDQSGVDIPQEGIWRNSLMQAGFDTFYEDRYLTITDHRAIAAAVSSAPFDALFIIANDAKYGGGGIYNSYGLGTSDNKWSLPVFIHEFGHSFAGLGDEYYDSSTGYDENFYPAGVEPWEPNVTTMVDFGSKWADMIAEGTPVPTPADSCYRDVTGVYEGAGYMAAGCWRPYIECRMKNNTAPGFCPVCQRAIDRMIDYYCK